MTFDLLTWISIGIIYSSRTIYLPSLKLLRQSVLEFSVCTTCGRLDDLWPWPSYLNINWDHLFSRTIYLPILKPLRQCCWVINCTIFTDIPTDMCKAICLLRKRGGGGGEKSWCFLFSKKKFKPVWQARVGTFQIFYTVTNILEIFSGPTNISLARIYVPLIF